VGRGFWREREDWAPARWREHLDGPHARFVAATLAAEEVGCFELVREGDRVQLEGFGLLPTWRGRSLGAGLLTAATREAFAFGARRVTLHTATDDHPHALPNYLARGYRVVREAPLANPMPARGPR
jgi:ribosomal protein S18 acetylase RimI-like enzyme